ncbi:hypothetical protein [Roseburia sp. 499]|uniref:hypothetical protein n=1 Tax=Roseburia sp. 499 TaxID=1261634 RepID=UPI0009F8AF57|nr:hypothetical protein [Roseburia sp. 499]WVK71528.1 hypothetical protein BIV20_08290 [Roseburia sp. 499]
MTDNELLLALSTLFDKKLKPIEESIQSLEGKVGSLEGKVGSLEGRVQSLEGKVQSMGENIQFLKLQNENNILPRLQNIEACYTSTYERYKNGITKMEQMQTDIDIIKSVVTEHSQRLEKAYI